MSNHRVQSQHGMSSSITGVAFAAGAAVIFSFLNLAIRFSEPHITVWHMMFGRSVFGVIFLSLAAKTWKIDLKGNNRFILVILGTMGTAGILCLTLALIRIPLFQALILFYTYPAVAALLSPLLTSDRITLFDWACIGLAFIGTAFILWSGQDIRMELSSGHIAAVAASMSLGVTITLIRKVTPVNHAFIPIFYISAIGTIICFFPLLLSGDGFVVSPTGYGWIFAIGILAVCAHLSTNQALLYLSSPKVGMIGMTETLLGALYGYILFTETLGWSTLAGGAFILLAGCGLIRSPDGGKSANLKIFLKKWIF